MFLVRVQQISGILIVLLMLLDVFLTYASGDSRQAGTQLIHSPISVELGEGQSYTKPGAHGIEGLEWTTASEAF